MNEEIAPTDLQSVGIVFLQIANLQELVANPLELVANPLQQAKIANL